MKFQKYLFHSYAQKFKDVYIRQETCFKERNSKILTDKDTEKNPLLHIEQSNQFCIEVGNFLEDCNILIYPDYESFDPQDKNTLDADRLDTNSDLLVILRYFEYVILAKFKVNFILPLWKEGQRTGDMDLPDIIDSIKHRLMMELQMKTPTFDNINTLDIHYLYKVRYVSPDMIISRRKKIEEN